MVVVLRRLSTTRRSSAEVPKKRYPGARRSTNVSSPCIVRNSSACTQRMTLLLKSLPEALCCTQLSKESSFTMTIVADRSPTAIPTAKPPKYMLIATTMLTIVSEKGSILDVRQRYARKNFRPTQSSKPAKMNRGTNKTNSKPTYRIAQDSAATMAL